jgi:hypothetical protein
MTQKQIKEYPDALYDALAMMDAHDICTAEEALDYLADDRSHGDEYVSSIALELIACGITRPPYVTADYRIPIAFMVAYIEAEAEIQRARDEVTA